MKGVTFTKYCHASDNCYLVEIGPLSIWFSYTTPVAFQFKGKRVVRENSWGKTTGKHLNSIDMGRVEDRITGEEFEKQLSKIFEQMEKVLCKI